MDKLKGQYTIFIVEDDLVVAQELGQGLEEQGFEILGIFSNEFETKAALKERQPDIILMDIDLTDGPKKREDGINLGQYIRTIYQLPILYMSSHSELLKSERITEDRFLKKPITSAEELSIYLLQELRRFHKTNDFYVQRFGTSFLIKPDRYVRIFYDDLICIKLDEGLVKFVLINGKSYKLSTSLSVVERQLQDSRMLKINKSFIINIDYITGLGDQIVYIEGEKDGLSCRREIHNLLKQSFNFIKTKTGLL